MHDKVVERRYNVVVIEIKRKVAVEVTNYPIGATAKNFVSFVVGSRDITVSLQPIVGPLGWQ